MHQLHSLISLHDISSFDFEARLKDSQSNIAAAIFASLYDSQSLLQEQDRGVPIEDETTPYEEVQNSPSSVYAKLNRDREDENENDKTYQKLLKRDSDYVIPNDGDGEHSYEEVGKKSSPPDILGSTRRNE